MSNMICETEIGSPAGKKSSESWDYLGARTFYLVDRSAINVSNTCMMYYHHHFDNSRYVNFTVLVMKYMFGKFITICTE